MNEATDHYLPSTYIESRRTFRNHLDAVRKKWPDAKLITREIGKEDDNTIDMIFAEGTSSNDQVVFFTSGEHGIEGYAGAGMIHLFIDEFMEQVNQETTGICLIHALNPWGMRNYRRVTENNVDLNRNYWYNGDSIPEDVNTRYANETDLFLPNGPINDLSEEKKKLYAQLTKGLLKEGYSGIKEAKGMGQFQFERGVYYGGKHEEESTIFLKEIQRDLLERFPKVIHMDWHTALGPTNEVTMLTSEHDDREEKELQDYFGMENIEKFTPKKVKGDSTNHFHKLKVEDYPERYLFSALFEFGTFGTSKKAEIREFMTIILENQLYWEGADNEADRQWVLDEFRQMFYPPEIEWRSSVLKEGRHAMQSVLTSEGIL